MPSEEQILTAGIIQALNLDFLHPIGLQARVVDGSRIEIHSFTEATGPILYNEDQIRTHEFRATRIAYLRWRKRQILRRAGFMLRYQGLQDDGVYQVVPGAYCHLCGCTPLEACPTPTGPCSWSAEPDVETGDPGVCSLCAVVEASLEG